MKMQDRRKAFKISSKRIFFGTRHQVIHRDPFLIHYHYIIGAGNLFKTKLQMD